MGDYFNIIFSSHRFESICQCSSMTSTQLNSKHKPKHQGPYFRQKSAASWKSIWVSGVSKSLKTPPLIYVFCALLCATSLVLFWIVVVFYVPSFGILGQPLKQFSCTTLLPKGRKKKDGDVEDDEDEADEDENDDAGDNNDEHSCIRVRGSKSSLMRCKSTGVDRHGKTSRTNTGISRATTEAVTSDTEWRLVCVLDRENLCMYACVCSHMLFCGSADFHWHYKVCFHENRLEMVFSDLCRVKAERERDLDNNCVFIWVSSCLPHFQKNSPGLPSHTLYLREGVASEFKSVSFLPAGGAVE